MKKIFLLCVLCSSAFDVFSQRETFDLTTYTVPKEWVKEEKQNVVIYSFIDKKDKSWCQIAVYRSITSKGTIEQDFADAWQDLVAVPFKTTDPPQGDATQEAEGWKIKAAGGTFIHNNANAIALLSAFTGYNRTVDILATTNAQRYIDAIEKFTGSIDLKKPGASDTVSTNNNVQPTSNAATSGSFVFTTTNFDDGWISTVQENWVEVTKKNIKVLIHYPNAKADAYNSVLKESDYNAWNILVASRYNNMTNFEWKTIQSWQSITFMQADAVENATGKTVHIVLFKQHYSNGSGAYLEFVTSNKAEYESEFGPYHNTEFDWDKTANMQFRNKFAVAASDFSGIWTNDFTGIQQYVNVYSVADAGMSSYSSKQIFQFGSGNKYNWEITVASGMVGNIKFQTVKSNGNFSILSNWQVKFSDMEGKPKTYDAYFSCVKGSRLLWLSDASYPGYSAYGKAN